MSGQYPDSEVSGMSLPGVFGPRGHEKARDDEERRIVTILFCDVAGSTALAEGLDPEEWGDIMREAFGSLIAPIERYGGVVGRLMGDAVLAFFGAPNAHEDDPQRAILAGLAMIDALQPLRERVRAAYGLDFNVRVGINTGLVVVGAFGARDRFEYTAMGDAINVAAKTQQAARPGAVYVAPATYRLTSPLFEFEQDAVIDAHGAARGIPIYRVTRAVAPSGRLWDVASLNMPLVDRARELAILRDAYDGLLEGRGKIVLVVGDAGIGKSRLLEEFREHARSRAGDVVWLENRLSSHNARRPYSALQQRVRQVYGLDPADSPDTMREKIARVAARYPAEFGSRLAPIVERVLAIDTSAERHGPEGEAFQREMRVVMREMLRNWNHGGPVAFVGDDYHWFDEQSADLMEHIFGLVEEMPILFVSAFRPDESSPAWRLRHVALTRYPEHTVEIRLGPLDEQSSATLVDALLEAPEELSELRATVLEKADGNPLFIEEIVRALSDRGVLVRRDDCDEPRFRPAPGVDIWDVTIPDSVHALLQQRIDRLSAVERRALLQASVIGRVFRRSMLAAIMDDAQLGPALDALERLGLIQQTVPASEREPEYVFRHTLVWDAAYSTLSRKRRQETHRRVAEALERLHADRLDEWAAALGHHYAEARDQRAIRWLLTAAEQAESVYAPAAVIEAVNKAQALAASFGTELPYPALLLRGNAAELTGAYPTARRDFSLARERARAQGVPCDEWKALIRLGMAWAERDYERAGEHFRAALALSEELPDEWAHAHSLNRLGNWFSNVGRPREAMQAHYRARAIFERLGHSAGIAETRDQLGIASYLAGNIRASGEHFREAAALFRELDDRQGLASALAMQSVASGTLHGVSVRTAPNPAPVARALADEALRVSREIGWEAGESFALASIGALADMRGDGDAALSYGEQALRVAERIGHRQWTVNGHVVSGVTKRNLYLLDEALEHMEQALAGALEVRSVWWAGASAAQLASTLILTGDVDRARDTLQSVISGLDRPSTLAERECWLQAAALELATGNPDGALAMVRQLERNQRGIVPHLALLRGQALARLGLADEAERALRSARRQAVRNGCAPLVWRADAALAALLRDRGDHERAERSAALALEGIDAIAASLTDAALRERFTAGAARHWGLVEDAALALA